MKRLRPMFTTVLLGALVAGMGPAGAHEEISPSSVVTGRAAFLTFTVANERQVAVTSVTLAPPTGLGLGLVTREPEGWAAARAQGGITWSGGSLASGKFEQWGVELEAPDQPGAFTFRSTLGFADGRTDSHDVALTVSSASGSGATAPAAPTVATTAATVTTLAVGPAPTAPAGGADGGVGSARRQANLALAVGGGGLVVGLLALVLAARRPRAGGAVVPPAEQEW